MRSLWYAVGTIGTLLAGAAAFAGLFQAREQAPSYSYVTGLDPLGDNWLALKAAPDMSSTRLAQLEPNTLVTVIGQDGAWLHVRLRTGQEGWVHGEYIACCRQAND